MIDVFVIGVGGVGQKVLDDLPQVMAYELDEKRSNLILCDGDSFEEKNLLRQKLTERMIGQNKAECYARMISARFSTIHTVAHGYYMTPENIEAIIGTEKRRIVFLLLAVDSIRTRKMINDWAIRNLKCPFCIISGGNELEDGSVQVFRKGGYNDALNKTAPLDKWHPEVRYPADKHKFDLSCDELRKSEPQLILTNRAVATAMSCAFRKNHEILVHGKDRNLDYGEVYVDINRNR